MPQARDTGRARAIPEPSRRNLLAGGAAALAVGAAIACQAKGATINPDAELAAALAAFWRENAAVDAWNAGRMSEDEGERHNDLWWELVFVLTITRAQTEAGQRAKAGAALAALEKVDAPRSDAEWLARVALSEVSGRPLAEAENQP